MTREPRWNWRYAVQLWRDARNSAAVIAAVCQVSKNTLCGFAQRHRDLMPRRGGRGINLWSMDQRVAWREAKREWRARAVIWRIRPEGPLPAPPVLDEVLPVRPRQAPRAKRDKAPVLPRPEPVLLPPPEPVLLPSPLPKQAPMVTRLIVPPAERSRCCFPIGEPRRPGFRFCDAAVERPPYCAEHRALCFVPIRPRDMDAIERGEA